MAGGVHKDPLKRRKGQNIDVLPSSCLEQSPSSIHHDVDAGAVRCIGNRCAESIPMSRYVTRGCDIIPERVQLLEEP